MRRQGDKRQFGRVALRGEAWGGLLLDGRHDRVWGFGRDEWRAVCAAFEGARPGNPAVSAFLAEYGPGAPAARNPYRLRRFFLGALPGVSEFALAAPISVSWCITNRCQSACAYCCTDSHPAAHDGLPPAETLQVVDKLADWGALRLIVGGGEPLLRPDLMQVLEHATARGLQPTLATNGLLLQQLPMARLRDAVMLAQVSLDSLDEETYARLRGSRGGPATVVAALEKLVAADVPVRVVTVLTSGNEGELEEIGARLASLGVAQWFVFVVQPSGRARRHFERHAPLDVDAATARLAALAAAQPRLSISVWGNSPDDQVAVYVTSAGELQLHDYGSGRNQALTSLVAAGGDELRRLWSLVRPEAQRATLINFTSAARNIAAAGDEEPAWGAPPASC